MSPKLLISILVILIIFLIVEVKYMKKLVVERGNEVKKIVLIDEKSTMGKRDYKESVDSKSVNYGSENMGKDIYLAERNIDEKKEEMVVPLFVEQKNKRGVVWAEDSEAYQSLFEKPKSFVTKSYREVMEEKKELTCDSIGFNRAFETEIGSALREPGLERAKELFEGKKYEAALKILLSLADRSTNIMTKAICWSYISKIYDEIGDMERFRAARANLAIMSAKVAKRAFPNILTRMANKSPEVDKAITKLINGKLLKIR